MQFFQALKLCFVGMVLMLAIACSPSPVTSTPPTTPVAPSTLPSASPPSATVPASPAPSQRWMETIQTILAQQLGVSPAQIQLKQATPMEWSDACLGLPQPDEFCAQVVTPGYQATFSTPLGDYLIHSDRLGQSVRIASPAPGST